MPRHATRTLTALVVVAATAVSACGATSDESAPSGGRLEHVPGSPYGRIVLTPTGARNIGIQTAPTRAVAPRPAPRAGRHARAAQALPRRSSAVIPYAAVVYAPSGRTFAFVARGPLVYTEVPLSITHITGESAFLTQGPAVGERVVTVGAEELFGLQAGVSAET